MAQESAHLTQVASPENCCKRMTSGARCRESVVEYTIAGKQVVRSFHHLSSNKSVNEQAQRHEIKEALTAFNVQVEKTLSNQVCEVDC